MKFPVLPCGEHNLNKPVTKELREKEGNGHSGAEKGVGYVNFSFP